MEFTLVRDEIPRSQRGRALLIRPGIGDTARERIEPADHRRTSFPGLWMSLAISRTRFSICAVIQAGLLSEGVGVADKFLKKSAHRFSSRPRVGGETTWRSMATEAKDHPSGSSGEPPDRIRSRDRLLERFKITIADRLWAKSRSAKAWRMLRESKADHYANRCRSASS